MSRPDADQDLLRSARIAAASPGVCEAVRAVALTALRGHPLTASHIAAVARTIGEGIGSVDVTPVPPVRDTLRDAWQGLEDAVGQALQALEAASREFAEGRARLCASEREGLLAEIAQMEHSLASGWDYRRRIPDSLKARITAVSANLGRAPATEPATDGAGVHDAGRVLSVIATGVLAGRGATPPIPPRS